jgi:hypothetical protein
VFYSAQRTTRRSRCIVQLFDVDRFGYADVGAGMSYMPSSERQRVPAQRRPVPLSAPVDAVLLRLARAIVEQAGSPEAAPNASAWLSGIADRLEREGRA